MVSGDRNSPALDAADGAGGASLGWRQFFEFSAGLRFSFVKISVRGPQRVNPRHLGW